MLSLLIIRPTFLSDEMRGRWGSDLQAGLVKSLELQVPQLRPPLSYSKFWKLLWITTRYWPHLFFHTQHHPTIKLDYWYNMNHLTILEIKGIVLNWDYVAKSHWGFYQSHNHGKDYFRASWVHEYLCQVIIIGNVLPGI